MQKQIVFILLLLSFQNLFAQSFICSQKENNSFPLVTANRNAAIYVSEEEDWLVQKAALLLQSDMEKVTGKKPKIIHSFTTDAKNIIIIGSLEKSPLIKQLIQAGKLKTDSVKNKWEAYLIQCVKQPYKGVDNALMITGSDRRGTAYGVFELSQQLGVSPWYWWADVPVKKKKEVWIKNDFKKVDAPKVKYRGIFLNDEAPALSGWSKATFGGFNHFFYEKVFELLLRLKANYLWPAMWGNAFNDDDTLNPVLANQYGIVMGTSHHEPMLRAQQEWKRYGKGAWDYTTNDSVLRSFWRKGIENMDHHESLVTIGMRGDGDKPMTEGTATALLEKIVADQREIIAEVTQKPAAATPQLWALYKEVQDYYDKGMRVPDDVTLLLCDDNWGNIRKLPRLTDKPRSGGYGIYYHFDYVGGPRNYKWINTNNISRVWEQMHLAYEYGVNKIWIVNVGDLKPMEFPISFFLDYAWNPNQWNEDNLKIYYTQWASHQFGAAYAREIGSILRKYAQYAPRRKPELLDAHTYSLSNYGEADRILNQWIALEKEAERINQQLPHEYKDAYFELVLHPIKAFTNLHQLYYAVAKNKLYAAQKNLQANQWADKAKQFFINDSLITKYYNDTLANGKWPHMMDQTHIGYTYWQEPPINKMPEVTYVSSDSAKATQVVDKSTNNKELQASASVKSNPVFYEKEGYISILASHYTRAINSPDIQWKVIPDIGREGDGITTFPVTAGEQNLQSNSPHLEYEIFAKDTGSVQLFTYCSPTLNFHNNEGLKFAVSIDEEQPQIVFLNQDDNNQRLWNNWVADNIIIKPTELKLKNPGRHVVKFWRVSPAVVLQKLVIDFGGVKQSYLGPPETNEK